MSHLTKMSMILVSAVAMLRGQEAPVEDLSALLATPVASGTTKQSDPRKAPGVITVITRDEVLSSGATNLADLLLRLVPGYDVTSDVQGSLALNARGLNVYEGLVAVRLNGILCNELSYGTVTLNERAPLALIKRIVVSRSPGSVTEGGFAAVGIIDIELLSPDEVKHGVLADVTLQAKSGSSPLRRVTSFAHAKRVGELEYSIGGSVTNAHLSDERHYFINGSSDMSTWSQVDNRNLYAMAQWKRVKLQVLHENFTLANPEGEKVDQHTPFKNDGVNLTYSTNLGSSFTLNLKGLYLKNTPWGYNVLLEDGSRYSSETTTRRFAEECQLEWHPNEKWWMNVGFVHTSDFARVYENGNELPTAPKGPISNTGFMEATYSSPICDIISGVRYEHNSEFGNAVVPRFAITKALGNFHGKLMWSKAFRAPAIYNIANQDSSEIIKPVYTTTREIEAGWRSGSLEVTVSIYDIHLTDPLVWGSSGYKNGGSIDSQGFGITLKKFAPWGHVTGNFSNCWSNKNTVLDWSVPDHERNFPGASPQKGSILASFRLSETWQIQPSILWMSSKFGYQWNPKNGSMEINKFDSKVDINLQATYTHRKWHATVGMNDLLNKKHEYAQGYNGFGSALPGPGRTFKVSVGYGF